MQNVVLIVLSNLLPLLILAVLYFRMNHNLKETEKRIAEIEQRRRKRNVK